MRTRREFLLECSSALAGAVFFPPGLVGGAAVFTSGFTSLSQISYSLLARQVGTAFLVQPSPGRTVALTLIETSSSPPAPEGIAGGLYAGASIETFSLIFSGPHRALLEAGAYLFVHARLGRFEMYIGPIGRPDADGVYYEAVVNRPATRTARSSVDG